MIRSRWLGLAGAAAIVTGLALGGEFAWQLWHAQTAANAAQDDAAGVLAQQWRAAIPTPTGPVAIGTPLARLSIPRFGDNWSQVLFEGVDQDTLAKGPGHYPGTGEPGSGNYAIAGHRVAGPFDQVAELVPCDPITATTRDQVLTYRVLPFDGLPSACRTPPVPGVPGREIVSPDDVAVIAPYGGAALLTITTCHPRFSARQRLIIHAVLVNTSPRTAT